MIKLIIFDLSNVCYNEEDPLYLKRFCNEHNLNIEEFSEEYGALLKSSEKGETSVIDVWEKLLKKYNINKNPEDVIKEIISLKKEDKEMLNYVQELRKKFKVAYLTNYGKEYWKEIQNKFNVDKYFDYGLASYQVGERKPHKKGFEMILKHFNVMPNEAVFTDDKENNLKEAKKIGINVIHFNGIEKFKKELTTLL